MGRTMPTECEHGVVIDWGDFGPDDGDLPTCDQCETRWANNASNLTRARALQAAATWQPWTPGVPERDAIAGLLALAETFAAWIEGETK